MVIDVVYTTVVIAAHTACDNNVSPLVGGATYPQPLSWRGSMDFDKLYKDNYSAVRGVVFSYLKREDDVDDVVQDTFLKAYQSLDTFNGNSDVTTWLTRIAINTAKDHLRAGKTKQKYTEPLKDEEYAEYQQVSPSDPLLTLDASEVEERILSYLYSLSEEQQELFTLKMVEGLSFTEVAKLQGINVNTAKSRCRRISERIKSLSAPE